MLPCPHETNVRKRVPTTSRRKPPPGFMRAFAAGLLHAGATRIPSLHDSRILPWRESVDTACDSSGESSCRGCLSDRCRRTCRRTARVKDGLPSPAVVPAPHLTLSHREHGRRRAKRAVHDSPAHTIRGFAMLVHSSHWNLASDRQAACNGNAKEAAHDEPTNARCAGRRRVGAENSSGPVTWGFADVTRSSRCRPSALSSRGSDPLAGT